VLTTPRPTEEEPRERYLCYPGTSAVPEWVAEGPMRAQVGKFTLRGDGLCVGVRLLMLCRRREDYRMMPGRLRVTRDSRQSIVLRIDVIKCARR
jgi:hypothetical protein